MSKSGENEPPPPGDESPPAKSLRCDLSNVRNVVSYSKHRLPVVKVEPNCDPKCNEQRQGPTDVLQTQLPTRNIIQKGSEVEGGRKLLINRLNQPVCDPRRQPTMSMTSTSSGPLQTPQAQAQAPRTVLQWTSSQQPQQSFKQTPTPVTTASHASQNSPVVSDPRRQKPILMSSTTTANPWTSQASTPTVPAPTANPWTSQAQAPTVSAPTANPWTSQAQAPLPTHSQHQQQIKQTSSQVSAASHTNPNIPMLKPALRHANIPSLLPQKPALTHKTNNAQNARESEKPKPPPLVSLTALKFQPKTRVEIIPKPQVRQMGVISKQIRAGISNDCPPKSLPDPRLQRQLTAFGKKPCTPRPNSEQICQDKQVNPQELQRQVSTTNGQCQSSVGSAGGVNVDTANPNPRAEDTVKMNSAKNSKREQNVVVPKTPSSTAKRNPGQCQNINKKSQSQATSVQNKTRSPGEKLKMPRKKVPISGKNPQTSVPKSKSQNQTGPGTINMVQLKKQLQAEIARLAKTAKVSKPNVNNVKPQATATQNLMTPCLLDGSCVESQQPLGLNCPNPQQKLLRTGQADLVRTSLEQPEQRYLERSPGVQSCREELQNPMPTTDAEGKSNEQDTPTTSAAVGIAGSPEVSVEREQFEWPSWRDNCPSITQKLRLIGDSKSWDGSIGADTLCVVGPAKVKFYVHSFVLWINSSYFESLNPNQIHKSSKVVEKGVRMVLVRLKNIAPTTFQMILQHMYSRRLTENIPVSVLTEVYRVAKYRFHMPELEKSCFDLLRNNKSLEGNSLRLFQLGRELEDSELERFSLQDVLRNAKSILESKDFLSLSTEEMLAVLESDELEVDSEITVFEAAVKWATNLCTTKGKPPVAENITNELGKVLYAVRLPLLTCDEFNVHVLPKEILPQNHLMTLCRFFMPPNISLPSDFPFSSKPRSPALMEGIILHGEDQSTFTITAIKIEPGTSLLDEEVRSDEYPHTRYVIETAPNRKRESEFNDVFEPKVKKEKVEDINDVIIVPTPSKEYPVIDLASPLGPGACQYICADSDSGRPNTASTYVASPPLASQKSPSPATTPDITESTKNTSDKPNSKDTSDVTLQPNRVENDSPNSHPYIDNDDYLHPVLNSRKELKASGMHIAPFKVPTLRGSGIIAFPVQVGGTSPQMWLTTPATPMEINTFWAKIKAYPKLECLEEIVAHLVVTDKSHVEPMDLLLPNIKKFHLHLQSLNKAFTNILGKQAQKEIFNNILKDLFSSNESIRNIIFMHDKPDQPHFDNMWNYRVDVKITFNGVTLLETGNYEAEGRDKKHKITCALLPYDSKPHMSLVGFIGKSAPHQMTLAGSNFDIRSYKFMAGPLMENLSILKIFCFEGVRKFLRACPNLKELRLDGRRKLTPTSGFAKNKDNPNLKPVIHLDDDLYMFDSSCKLKTLVLSEMSLEIGNHENLKRECQMTSPTFLFCHFQTAVFQYFERLFPRLKEIHERKYHSLIKRVLNMRDVETIVIWGTHASSQHEYGYGFRSSSTVEDSERTHTGVKQASLRTMMNKVMSEQSNGKTTKAFILKRLPTLECGAFRCYPDTYRWHVTEFSSISPSALKLFKVAYASFGYSEFMDFDAFVLHFQQYYCH